MSLNVLNKKNFVLDFDDAQKIVGELIVHTCVNRCNWRTKEKKQSKGTDGVPAKNPLKIKSEESSNNAKEYEL